jgi:hypothetical protein
VSQRNSEYARIAGDTYVTPRWVYEALYSVEPWFEFAFDPAPIDADFDYLTSTIKGTLTSGKAVAIATNPPFRLAEKFVRKALKEAGLVAMLLPMQWDAAKTRRDLFEHPPFKAKYTLTKRIRWENLEQKKNGPSTNHAWYVWDYTYNGKPFMGWLP